MLFLLCQRKLWDLKLLEELSYILLPYSTLLFATKQMRLKRRRRLVGGPGLQKMEVINWHIRTTLSHHIPSTLGWVCPYSHYNLMGKQRTWTLTLTWITCGVDPRPHCHCHCGIIVASRIYVHNTYSLEHIYIYIYSGSMNQCPGRFLGIIGLNPSVSKSTPSHGEVSLN